MNVPKPVTLILSSPWFIALLPSAFVFTLLPGFGDPYTLEIIPARSPEQQILYEDLDGDGNTERLLARTTIPFNNIIIQDNGGATFDQWNLKDQFKPDLSDINIGDIDRDNKKEIYIFTVSSDSLFLNINEFFDTTGIRLESQFITTLRLVKGEVIGNTLRVIGFFDTDNDGVDEIYFSINSGFGLEPRLLYYFNLPSKQITRSQFTGINILDAVMEDLDGDGFPEIFGETNASGNYATPGKFSDYSSWLMVFDHHLQFKFAPVEFPGFGNKLQVKKLKHANKHTLVALHTANGASNMAPAPALMIYSPDGKLLSQKPLSTFASAPSGNIIQLNTESGGEQLILISAQICELNGDLDLIRRVEHPFRHPSISQKIDFNADGVEEIAVYSPSLESLLVIDQNLEKISEARLKLSFPIKYSYSHSTDGGTKKLFVSASENSCWLTLHQNPFFILKYVMYPGVYLAFFGFMLVIKKLYHHQNEKRNALHKRLNSLQLQSIKNQFDPHFTFNALNSVASLLYLEDKEVAYDYLTRFSVLLRQMLNDADKTYRTIGTELDFVTRYLDMEKLRFGERFSYRIHVEPGVTLSEEIPKMTIQIFVENSIKHGITPLLSGGLVQIRIEKTNGWIKITVEDNGVGRAQALQRNPPGKGLHITEEFYKTLNEISPRSVRYSITDLGKSANDTSGTRAEIWLKN